MPRFHWQAIDRGGQVIEGEMEAADHGQVVANLRRRGCGILRSERARGALLAPGFRGLSVADMRRVRHLDDHDVEVMMRGLVAMMAAGQPLDRALENIALMSGRTPAGRVATGLLVRVRTGMSLGDSMAAPPTVFPAYAIAMVRAGERIGGLDIVLGRLAAIAGRRRESHRAAGFPGGWRLIRDARRLDWPWVGRARAEACAADLLRRLGVLSGCGVAPAVALALATDASRNAFVIARMQPALRAVEAGADVAVELLALPWFPKAALTRLREDGPSGAFDQTALAAAWALEGRRRSRRHLCWMAVAIAALVLALAASFILLSGRLA